MEQEWVLFLLNLVPTTVLTPNILHYNTGEIDVGVTMTLLLSQDTDKETVRKQEDLKQTISTRM